MSGEDFLENSSANLEPNPICKFVLKTVQTKGAGTTSACLERTLGNNFGNSQPSVICKCESGQTQEAATASACLERTPSEPSVVKTVQMQEAGTASACLERIPLEIRVGTRNHPIVYHCYLNLW